MKKLSIIFLTLSIFIAFRKFASSSNNAEPNFCQWEAFYFRSQTLCGEKCADAIAFIHPIKKQLTCYDNTWPTFPVLTPSRNEGLYTCECVRPYPISGSISCDPEIKLENITGEDCYRICEKFTVYLHVQNRREEIYCGETSKIILLDLESSTSVVTHTSKKGKAYVSFSCRCGLNLKSLNQKENEVKLRRFDTVSEENKSELKLECQFGKIAIPVTVGGKDSYCAGKCFQYMGYVSPRNELLCFHRIDSTTVISRKNYKCKCGYKSKLSSHKKNRKCEPELVFPSITNYEQCKMKCSEHVVTRLHEKKKVNIAWCGQIFNPNSLFLSVDYKINMAIENSTSASCQCGLRSFEKNQLVAPHIEGNNTPENDESNEQRLVENDFGEIASTEQEVTYRLNGKYYSRKRIQKNTSHRTNDIAVACHQIGMFTISNKQRCFDCCFHAKGYFSPNGNELICYHRKKTATTVKYSVEGKGCECGTVINKGKPEKEATYDCIPKQIYPADNLQKCNDVCNGLHVYIFHTFPRQRVVRCELKDYAPTRLFPRLNSKVGHYKKVRSKKGRKSSEYPCECGLNSSLGNDLDTKDDSSPHALINDRENDELTDDFNEANASTEAVGDIDIPMTICQHGIETRGREPIRESSPSLLPDLNIQFENSDPEENSANEIETRNPNIAALPPKKRLKTSYKKFL